MLERRTWPRGKRQGLSGQHSDLCLDLRPRRIGEQPIAGRGRLRELAARAQRLDSGNRSVIDPPFGVALLRLYGGRMTSDRPSLAGSSFWKSRLKVGCGSRERHLVGDLRDDLRDRRSFEAGDLLVVVRDDVEFAGPERFV